MIYRTKIIFGISIIFIIFICISGCTSETPITQTNPVQNPENFGNGVLYFHGIREDAGYAISNYIQDNPKLHIVAIASDDTGIYGHTVGYFVIVENKT